MSAFAEGVQTTRLPAGQRGVRQHNLALVMRHVATARSSTRAQLAASTGLTKATVSSLVSELVCAHLLVDRGTQPSGGTGRPGSVLEIDRSRHAGIGLEINVDYIAACVTDLGHSIRYHRVELADNRAEPEAALKRLARSAVAAQRAAEELGLTPAGVALALPGIVDPEGGRLLHAPNLGWSDLDIAEHLAAGMKRDPAEIHLDNEANLAALGELWFGNGEAWGDFVYVSGEIGIGAGIVTGGRMYRGARGFAGEIGHISIDPKGEPCGCGGRGCLERYCGQEAILRSAGLPTGVLTTSTANPDGAIADLVNALRNEKPKALRAARKAGEYLSIGLANVVNVVDPHTVVLGGMFTPLAQWMLEPFVEGIQRQSIAARWGAPEVTVSTLGPEAAVRGAAGLVIQQLMADPSRVARAEAI